MKPEQKICLNMIVKNESKVIERCLASVKDIIDSWAVVDTGSTDGTQQVISEFLQDLPGQLVERPWVDFAHNRTEALRYVPDTADYILVLDADEELVYEEGFSWPFLDEDCYYIETRLSTIHYYRIQLVKRTIAWRWESKLHEYLTADRYDVPKLLKGLYNLPRSDGHRSSNPHKFKQDALLLEQAILEEPDNARYVFYLAQSYRDCNDMDLAIRNYTKRVQMGGWREEVWYSLYQIALLRFKKGDPWEIVQMGLLDAYNYRHTRAEPLAVLARYYLGKNAWPLAYLFAQEVVKTPYPNDLLFIEPAVYNAHFWIDFAKAAMGVERWQEAVDVCNRALDLPNQTESVISQMNQIKKMILDNINI